jgi:hypothetical protein
MHRPSITEKQKEVILDAALLIRQLRVEQDDARHFPLPQCVPLDSISW